LGGHFPLEFRAHLYIFGISVYSSNTNLAAQRGKKYPLLLILNGHPVNCKLKLKLHSSALRFDSFKNVKF